MRSTFGPSDSHHRGGVSHAFSLQTRLLSVWQRISKRPVGTVRGWKGGDVAVGEVILVRFGFKSVRRKGGGLEVVETGCKCRRDEALTLFNLQSSPYCF